MKSHSETFHFIFPVLLFGSQIELLSFLHQRSILMAKRKDEEDEIIFLGEYSGNKSSMINRKRQATFCKNMTSTFRTTITSSYPTPILMMIEDDTLQDEPTKDDAAIAKALEDLDRDLQKKNQVESQTVQLIEAIQVADQLDLHEQLNHAQAVTSKIASLSIVHPELETLDPNPDIFKLFQQFDNRFFDGFLSTKALLLKWENLGSDAGRFTWRPKSHNVVPVISLSDELIRLRPRRDLVETLLHEMIHAYIYFKKIRDNAGHGRVFKQHMNRINRDAGTKITVYHQFFQEVEYVSKRKAQALNRRLIEN